MDVFNKKKTLKVLEHCCSSLFCSHTGSSAVASGVEAGGRLWDLNKSLVQFVFSSLPHSHLPLSPILLKKMN